MPSNQTDSPEADVASAPQAPAKISKVYQAALQSSALPGEGDDLDAKALAAAGELQLFEVFLGRAAVDLFDFVQASTHLFLAHLKLSQYSTQRNLPDIESTVTFDSDKVACDQGKAIGIAKKFLAGIFKADFVDVIEFALGRLLHAVEPIVGVHLIAAACFAAAFLTAAAC